MVTWLPPNNLDPSLSFPVRPQSYIPFTAVTNFILTIWMFFFVFIYMYCLQDNIALKDCIIFPAWKPGHWMLCVCHLWSSYLTFKKINCQNFFTVFVLSQFRNTISWFGRTNIFLQVMKPKDRHMFFLDSTNPYGLGDGRYMKAFRLQK